MEWYVKRLEELKKKEPRLSLCGDDCAVCPRFLAQTEEELRETALFWFKAGWRDRVVSIKEIRCDGCESRPVCSLMLSDCVKEHRVKKCSLCGAYPCEKWKGVLESSYAKKENCRKACECEEEFRMFERAFYEKEKNI